MNEKPLILVIDDNPDLREMFNVMMPLKGYRVISVSTSKEAKEQLQQHPDIALILLDMLLSGENGLDISAELKTMIPERNIPIIIMSAHPNLYEHVSNISSVDDYIEKPFNMQDAFRKINQWINQSA